MEDGDPSYSMHKPSLAHHLKEKYWIPNLIHPTQSLDLNTIEACWNILKQRMRNRYWDTEEELKEVL
jgi:transposase